MKISTQLFSGYLLVFGLMVVIAGVSYNGFNTHIETGGCGTIDFDSGQIV